MPDRPATLPRLIAIAAMTSDRVIGRDGKLPWHLPEDLKFFKRTTLGHPVLMGRRTFDSIIEAIGKPLPGRTNIVLSTTMPPRPDAEVIRDLGDLAKFPDLASPVYLIGGAQLYAALLPHCDELIITLVKTPHEGDAWFPEFEHLFELKEVLGESEGLEFRRYVKRV